MPLAMSRPWKHPNSGVYWLRKGVPEDLRALLGKREEKRSLLTRDPVEAKRRHAQALAEIELKWANLRSGPKTLSEREAHQLAMVVHDHWLQQHIENPSLQTVWRVDLSGRLFKPAQATQSFDHLYIAATAIEIDRDELRAREMEKWCLEWAKERASDEGLLLDEAGHRTLAKAIAAALQRASVTLEHLAQGGGNQPSMLTPPTAYIAAQSVHQPLPLADLLSRWAKERRPAEKTVYEWSRVARQLAEFLGHDDAKRMTNEDLIAWKQSMVEAGLRPKTIQDAKLAPLRAIFRWGVQNKRLASNPAEGVSLDVRSKQGEKKRSFTDEEAKIILRAAMAEKDPVRRWVPWIGAYSGARVSEICQLRAEDIIEVDRIWCMKLDPEAGSLKTSGSERIIPLHEALIESGFLKFVREIKGGPLFADLSPDKFGKRGGNGTKVIGRFVRQLGLMDPRLSPSHSWRHRIKTSGRKYGLAQDILDAITGHGARSVADSYGEFPVEALYRELSKIPILKL